MKKVKKTATRKVSRITAKSARKNGNSDKATLREFNAKKLAPVKNLSSKAIKEIREKSKVSQPVFAAHLNVSASTVKKWETGEKRPQGSSLKLLNVVSRKGLAIIA